MRSAFNSWIVFCVLLVTAGTGMFLYKVLYLRYPLSTAGQPPTWRVEQVISLTGDGRRVVVEAPLPSSSGYQTLLTEEVRSGMLRFSISEGPGGRRGRWSGKLEGSTTVSYQVTASTHPYGHKLPATDRATDYSERTRVFLSASGSVQANDAAVRDLSRELALSSADKSRLAMEIFTFASREIGELRASGTMDAVSVIREGRGDPLGRARLFCALARTNQLPCRIISGLLLAGRRPGGRHYWNEVYVGGRWIPFDATRRIAEVLPADRVALSASDDPDIESSGTQAVSHRFYVQSETELFTDLIRRRIAASQDPIDRLSPVLLPLQTQQNLRLLLLVPLGALAMAVLRNVVGIRTFGTFMPMLIALAMTATGLVFGTVVLLTIIGLALMSRLWIQRFYLLMAPRIAFTLTFVVLLMVLLMVVGDHFRVATAGIGVFPFVIMTMIVERITVSLEEEGTRNTLRRVASTLFAIYATYAVIQARVLQMAFLVFPELLVIILGLLVIVGRYTGYRVVELIRFRELVRRPTPSPASPTALSGVPDDHTTIPTPNPRGKTTV